MKAREGDITITGQHFLSPCVERGNIKVIFLQTNAIQDFDIGEGESIRRGGSNSYGPHCCTVLNVLGKYKVIHAVDGVFSLQHWLQHDHQGWLSVKECYSFLNDWCAMANR